MKDGGGRPFQHGPDPPPGAPPGGEEERGTAGDPTAAGERGVRFGWLALLVAVVAATLAGALVLGLTQRLLRPSEEDIRGAIYAAIQRERPETFLVTGSVDLTATTTVRNTRRLLPGIIDLNLGTTSATVRMPGRISYGVDLSRIRPGDIRVDEAGRVTLVVPPPEVWSAEPVLTEMEVQTEVGWARLYSRSGRAVEQEAIRLMETALLRQGRAHLADSDQPRRNSAQALERVLLPALTAAGVDDPSVTVLFTDSPTTGTDSPETRREN